MSHVLEKLPPPDPSRRVLDPRLMTWERMVELGGDRPVTVTITHDGVFLDCVDCGGGITIVATPTQPICTTPVQLLAATIRHWAMVHDVPLSGAAA